jgi:hypothetical protein
MLSANRQRIESLMRAASGSEPVGEALEVDLIDSVEDRHHGLLNDFVLECRDVQRALPPVSLRNKDSPRGVVPDTFRGPPGCADRQVDLPTP